MATERGLGLQTLIRNDVSGDYPFSYTETPSGLLLMANGIDPMIKWDGLAQVASTAGVKPPSSAMELGGVGLGRITGTLVSYQRFIDGDGNVSDLSPASNVVEAGFDGLIEDISYDRATAVVTVTSSDHGLTTGATILIDDVEGIEIVNGPRTITVVDEDIFTLDSFALAGGVYTQGGVWTLGILSVVYGAVPVPVEFKVARRQILRNLAGNADVLYVDIDTDDLASTAFVSQATDEILATGESVPMTYGDDDMPYANRNGVPPSHKSVVASHKGRIFAAADATYSEGHAEVRFNSATVQGVGTNWRSTFSGRLIYLEGARIPYPIASVDEGSQVITLSKPYMDAPRPFSSYVIRPESGERRLVYYSEPSLPESWPAYNAIAVPEDNDEITGLVSLGQYLYVIERRHIHRLTFQEDPTDGYVFLSAQRGSLNNQTYAVTDSDIYFLDEIGIHKFDEQKSTPISQPIQNLFQQDGISDVQVDWTADQSTWHAAHDPIRDTVRWFVTMVGTDAPYHAICYNYRTDRWWVERYPTAMTASANVTIGGRRSLAGTAARRVVCLSEGTYDGVSGEGTVRGNVSSATTTTIVDSSASFFACEGAPVAIVDGLGVGQVRIVAEATATQLEVVHPWDVTPDETSVYQIGGISWTWRSGWFRYVDDEADSPRDVEVVFRPTLVPGSMDIQLYFDHAQDPRYWSRDIDQDGVKTTTGSPRIVVDLRTGIGWARQRISGHSGVYSFGDTFVSVELSGFQAGSPVRVSQVAINGVEDN